MARLFYNPEKEERLRKIPPVSWNMLSKGAWGSSKQGERKHLHKYMNKIGRC